MPGCHIDDVIAEKQAEYDALQRRIENPAGTDLYKASNILHQQGVLKREINDLKRKRDGK